MFAEINNDYDDYLGTGIPLKNTGTLHSLIARYLNRIKGDWFIGGQGIYQEFFVAGTTPDDELILDTLGVVPYKSGGLGAVIYHDSRDNENKPSDGRLLSVNDMAYRESLGGENDFDVYRIDFRYYQPQGKGNVFTMRQLNHLTSDAPTVARASIQLRGYKIGEYNEVHVFFRSRGKVSARREMDGHAFRRSGLPLRGRGQLLRRRESLLDLRCRRSVRFKPKEGMVLNLEYAEGEGENYGVYLKIGYAY